MRKIRSYLYGIILCLPLFAVMSCAGSSSNESQLTQEEEDSIVEALIESQQSTPSKSGAINAAQLLYERNSRLTRSLKMKEPLSKKLPCLEDSRSYKNSPLRIIRRTGQNLFIEFGFRCSMMVLGNSVISESNPPQGRVS